MLDLSRHRLTIYGTCEGFAINSMLKLGSRYNIGSLAYWNGFPILSPEDSLEANC